MNEEELKIAMNKVYNQGLENGATYMKNEILKYINRNNELFMALGGTLFIKTLKKIEKIKLNKHTKLNNVLRYRI